VQGYNPPILMQEKALLGLTADTGPLLPAVPRVHQTPRALTGTLLGNYIQHRQCDRLLSFDFLPFAQQPAKRALVDSAVGAARAESGRAFEDRVLTWLQQQGVPLHRMAEQDATGRRLSPQERQTQSFDVLKKLVDTCVAIAAPTGEAPRPRWGRVRVGEGGCPRHVVGYLVQAVLVQPTPLGSGDAVAEQVEAIGIPDVIEVAVEDGAVELTIMDIKDSPTPRYAQQ
jgi:hypothetical protein